MPLVENMIDPRSFFACGKLKNKAQVMRYRYNIKLAGIPMRP